MAMSDMSLNQEALQIEGIRLEAVSERFFLMHFTEEASRRYGVGIHHLIRAWTKALQHHPLPGLVDFVPAYTSLGLIIDPVTCSMQRYALSEQASFDLAYDITDRLKTYGTLIEHYVEAEDQIVPIEIPVHYGGDDGPDLVSLAEEKHLTPEDVIELHILPVYTVMMVGFMPGFPYLEGLPEALYTPRLKSPRLKVPAGSVGIAWKQTGIYPFESPGGWRIIGRTDTVLFDVRRNPPARLQIGDRIRFKPYRRG
ncbi:MAG: 5-oxoprolinase subunit PxpB [Candidatus Carbobacillus sp.]|nr:5-oxoprolinase subunit PxpB [Candidatus Carbobacillus sp.]